MQCFNANTVFFWLVFRAYLGCAVFAVFFFLNLVVVKVIGLALISLALHKFHTRFKLKNIKAMSYFYNLKNNGTADSERR